MGVGRPVKVITVIQASWTRWRPQRTEQIQAGYTKADSSMSRYYLTPLVWTRSTTDWVKLEISFKGGNKICFKHLPWNHQTLSFKELSQIKSFFLTRQKYNLKTLIIALKWIACLYNPKNKINIWVIKIYIKDVSQTCRSMEQNREPRNKPIHIWSINLQKKNQE